MMLRNICGRNILESKVLYKKAETSDKQTDEILNEIGQKWQSYELFKVVITIWETQIGWISSDFVTKFCSNTQKG